MNNVQIKFLVHSKHNVSSLQRQISYCGLWQQQFCFACSMTNNTNVVCVNWLQCFQWYRRWWYTCI